MLDARIYLGAGKVPVKYGLKTLRGRFVFANDLDRDLLNDPTNDALVAMVAVVAAAVETMKSQGVNSAPVDHEGLTKWLNEHHQRKEKVGNGSESTTEMTKLKNQVVGLKRKVSEQTKEMSEQTKEISELRQKVSEFTTVLSDLKTIMARWPKRASCTCGNEFVEAESAESSETSESSE
jgi:hypothetical protein